MLYVGFTLFTLVANVTLERVKLQLQSFELSLCSCALALVDNQDDKDDGQHRSTCDCHTCDPVIHHHRLMFLILQLTEHMYQVPDANLQRIMYTVKLFLRYEC